MSCICVFSCPRCGWTVLLWSQHCPYFALLENHSTSTVASGKSISRSGHQFLSRLMCIYKFLLSKCTMLCPLLTMSAVTLVGWLNTESSFSVVVIFIHSFIPDISIVPLQVHYYSEALPITALILFRS